MQRWEQACALPVHRHGHRQSSSIYAFRSELEAWWLSRDPSDPDGQPQTGETSPPVRRQATDFSAHDLYEMARHEWNTRTVDGLRRSVSLASQAIDRAPGLGVAHAMLALANVVLASYMQEPSREPMERSRRAALRAIAIDDSLADAYTALGLINLSDDWRWADADRAFRRATELAPRDATAWSWYGFWNLSRGNEEQALVDTRRAERLDPESLIVQTQVGWILYFARRYAEGLDQLEKTLAREPRFWRAYLNAAWCYMAMGCNDDAVHALETTIALNDFPLLRTVLARAYARAGREGDARMTLERVGSSGEFLSAYYLAQARSALDEPEEAGRLLLDACEGRDWHLIFLRADPGLDELRSGSAYRDVADRMVF